VKGEGVASGAVDGRRSATGASSDEAATRGAISFIAVASASSYDDEENHDVEYDMSVTPLQSMSENGDDHANSSSHSHTDTKTHANGILTNCISLRLLFSELNRWTVGLAEALVGQWPLNQ
jgi:hypothetical protein